MRQLLLASVIVLLACSTASADWGYVAAPGERVVYYSWPAAPVYSYPAPVVVASPVIAPIPAVVPAPVIYSGPVLVRPRLFPGPWRGAYRVIVP
jgi:hypothetical protein